MAEVTITPQALFGSGSEGDEFYIDSSGSTFGIVSQNGDKLSAIQLLTSGECQVAITSGTEQAVVKIDPSDMSVTITNKAVDDSRFVVIRLEDNNIYFSTKETDQQAHIRDYR